ncbi:MAG: hypothetical protein ACJA0O_001337, partial [Porticoccus sp.]
MNMLKNNSCLSCGEKTKIKDFILFIFSYRFMCHNFGERYKLPLS